MRHWVFVFCLIAAGGKAGAQTVQQQNGWFTLNLKKSIAPRWSAVVETQTRSANHLAYINALVLRPGLTYKLTGKQTATIGYAYAAAWARTDTVHTFGLEHRIWEQYQIESFWRHAAIANRLRLEQGFFNQPAGRYFLLGVRYQIKTQLPLRRHPIFTRGLYMRLQDELFLHLANIQKISGSNFDQNRAYTALGYRASRHLEVEAGYLLRNQKLRRYAVENQVAQIACYASF